MSRTKIDGKCQNYKVLRNETFKVSEENWNFIKVIWVHCELGKYCVG